ncbi:NADP-dependent oxidoreductase [Corynebacterium mastitidis]
MHSNQIHLASRPTGWPRPENFRAVRAELPALGEGQVRVRNEYVSVDPYMRGRMSDAPSYIPPFELDAPMTGSTVGRVVESRAEALPTGALVTHQQGWRDVAQGPAEEFRAVDDAVSPSAYLGILGLTGMTAYAGLTRVGGLQPGETVFVSGAAGAVGSAVGQMARLLGARTVIGSAGGPEKAAMLTERYGFDVALDYKAAPIAEQLPGGIDVYFDNVGGDHLEAAIGSMNRFGRLVECGMISQYNLETPQPGPRNMTEIIKKSLRVEGFTLGDHLDIAPEFLSTVVPWLREGKLVYEETVVEGLDNAVEGFLSMMRGGNKGKMVVRV